VLLRLLLALVITVVGIFLGTILDSRSGERSEQPGYA
jgi:hypothetical protein